jgi:F-type H+-transporting ATPase subunit epsilon
MAETIKLDILTPLGAKREGVEVPGVEVPGVQGELGILPHHEALVTAIVPGVIRFRQGNESVRVAVGAGFLEVKESGRVVVLVERAALPKEVKVDAARAQLTEVEREIASHTGPIGEPRIVALKQEREWLQAQLRIVND